MDVDAVRRELLTHIEYLRGDIKSGFDGVNTRLDRQNGRIGALEKRESSHHERLGAVERGLQELEHDRNERDDEDTRPRRLRGGTFITIGMSAGGGALLLELGRKVLELLK